MYGHNIGFVSTSTLSIRGELGYRIIFDYSWCIVQDQRTGQKLGTSPRVRRMFPVDHLRLPLVAPISVAATAAVSSTPSLALWHARLSGFLYFVIFVDDYSCYNWIFNMKYHSELLQIYSNFAKMVETQFSKRIKIFRSDNALEYTQYAFHAVLHSYGIVHQLTCLGTSQ